MVVCDSYNEKKCLTERVIMLRKDQGAAVLAAATCRALAVAGPGYDGGGL